MILVLEDMEERVDHLRKFFPDLDIRWVTTVKALLATAAQKTPDAVILDHDLGGPFMGSSDAHGQTGTDAARLLKVKCAVCVWSWNPAGARRMVTELQARGARAVHVPFSENFATWVVLHPWFKDAFAKQRKGGAS